MGRLRRKLPRSARKKKQESRTRPEDRKPALRQKGAMVPTAQKRSVKDPGFEVPKAIKPSGRTFQPAFFIKTTQFLREVKVELKKVTWPSRKETMASTGVVIVLVVIISVFLGLVDMGLSSLIRFVLK